MTTRSDLWCDAVDNDTLRPSPAPWTSIIQLTVLDPLVDQEILVFVVAIVVLKEKQYIASIYQSDSM